MWHPIKHYKTIRHHKMLVMKNCFRCGLYWQGLTHDLSKLAPLATAWVLSLAAPVSWMVLSKAHAAIHTHLVPMLWHFALVPVSCLALVVMTKEIAVLLFRRKPDLVASH